MQFFYYIPYNIDLLKITCNHFILGSYISQISVFYNQPLLCQWVLPFTASVPDFSRYICSSISPSFSFYLSIPPFFFLLHPHSFIFSILNLSILFHAQLSLPSYLHVSSWLPLCLSLCWSVEGCALSGLCALAARPSTQQPLLLLNVTGPLLIPLSDVRVSAQCTKISRLQMISLTLKQ